MEKKQLQAGCLFEGRKEKRVVEKRVKKQKRRMGYKNQRTREGRICRQQEFGCLQTAERLTCGPKPIGTLVGNPPVSSLGLCPKDQVTELQSRSKQCKRFVKGRER